MAGRGEIMKAKHRVKIIREGQYVAEVDVDLVEAETEWSPHLSLEGAYKLDDVRDALCRGDIEGALKLARVYTLKPVTG